MALFKKKTEEEKKPAAKKAPAKTSAKTTVKKASDTAKKAPAKKTTAKDAEKKPAAKKATTKKATAKKATAKKAPAKKAAPKKQVRPSDAYRVLLRPLITEKSAQLASDGVYLFEVAPSAGKVEVAQAVRALYRVTPRKVNIANRKGKRVRFGRVRGQRRGWKKAMVFLKKGQTIDVYEGV